MQRYKDHARIYHVEEEKTGTPSLDTPGQGSLTITSKTRNDA